jgi:hypothetical protein
MPNNFKNAKQICTTSLTDVYTAPGGGGAASVVLLLQATNVTNRADVFTLVWTDSSNSNAVTHLCYQIPIPAQQSVGCLTGKLVLEASDKIRAQCGTFQAIELSCSFLEIT